LARLRAAFEGGTGPFPVRLVEQAETNFRDLTNSSSSPALLHADLHHWNILSAQRQPWLAIDPKGLIGEPKYETGAWLRNPFPDLLRWSNAREIIRRRANQFAVALNFDRERIYAWGVYQAVLAAWWSFESRDPNWRQWLAVAELISQADRKYPPSKNKF
jgi:streptomycin 6-kinase